METLLVFFALCLFYTHLSMLLQDIREELREQNKLLKEQKELQSKKNL